MSGNDMMPAVARQELEAVRCDARDLRAANECMEATLEAHLEVGGRPRGTGKGLTGKPARRGLRHRA